VFSSIARVRKNHIDTCRRIELFPAVDCIEVFKIYDQCITDVVLQGFEAVTDGCAGAIPENAVMDCSVVPGTESCLFTGFGSFTTQYFRTVHIINSVQVQAAIVSQQGRMICGPFMFMLRGVTSQVLRVPEGTLPQCSILNTGNCSCALATVPDTGARIIVCTVQISASIQTGDLVRLLVPSYGFYKPSACSPPSHSSMPLPRRSHLHGMELSRSGAI
jgi:hypothetical protein